MATSSGRKDEETEHLNSDEINSNVEVNIALVGQTESGKSSYVNALRGINKKHKEAAKTGDPTNVRKSYVHPKAPYIKLWDQPGHSTQSHPDVKVYSEFLKMKNYDAFLLFTKGCLTNTDILLVKKIASQKKQLFLVRTNVDYDHYNESRDETFKEEVMLEGIKKKILSNLEDLIYGEKYIFLISNIYPMKWDFKLLNEKIENYASEQLEEKKKEKRSLMNRALKYYTETVETVQNKGIKFAQQLNDQRLGKWKEIKINIAVIGETSVGKSSFINTIRNVNANDDESKKPAKVGSTKTTKTPDEYPYPGEGKISLWDIPAIGSSDAPDVKTYCEEFKILQHDAFIIMTAKSLNKLTISLAERLANINKQFLFVRARIDEDFANDNKEIKVSRDQFRKNMETDFRKEVARVDKKVGRNLDLFLINNDNPSDWDFPSLLLAIGKQLSLDQQQCFNFTQPAISKDFLQVKVKELKGRTWMVALKSTFVKFLTTKEYSSKVNGKRILEHLEFYRSQLGFPERPPTYLPKVAFQKFYITDEMYVKTWLKQFDEIGGYDEDDTTFLTQILALNKPYKFIDRSLTILLDKMEEIALTFFTNEDKD